MELIDGEIVVNSPSRRHQRLATYLVRKLGDWTDASPGRGEALIEVDHRLDDDNVYAPDVWWSPDGWTAPAPAIPIEVRSDSTWRYDVGVEQATHLAAGAVEVLTSPLLPGFRLSVRDLFDR